jgi:dihydrofolate reductase
MTLGAVPGLKGMTKLKFSISMSLDGYAAGPRQSRENPLGEGGMAMHAWAFAARGGGGAEAEYANLWSKNVGAVIMGRNMFGPIRGDWGDEQWNGWWGDDPPYHTPVFVLTHHEREPLEMQGGTTFNFVTDGIEAAFERATEAAAGRDISIGGGASTARQYLAAGLVDEMAVHVTPVLLGRGEPFLAGLGDVLAGYECVELASSPSPAVAHFSYVRKR